MAVTVRVLLVVPALGERGRTIGSDRCESIMPKALLDQFMKDEIFELLAFLEKVSPSGQ